MVFTSATNDDSQVDFEILSHNARGLDNEKKRGKVFNYIKKHTSSNAIIFLQETHSTKKDEMLWKLQWHGNIIFSHGSSNKKGVVIAFRYGLECKLLLPEIVDDDGRYIILHIEIQGSPYILLNYYGPNDESNQVKVLRQIFRKLQSINFDDNVQFILAGDWNMIFDKFLDAMGGTPSLKFNSLKQLQLLMVDYDLSDIWRARIPTFHQFTWRQTNPAKLIKTPQFSPYLK